MPGPRARVLPLIVVLLAGATALQAQQARTTQAFNQYITEAESRIKHEQNSPFLRFDSLLPAQRAAFVTRLKHGETIIQKQGTTPKPVPDGLIHDWIGTVFIPNTTVAQLVAFVKDYNHTAEHYSPDVIQSRLVSHNGNDFHVFMRLRQHKLVTVVLDTEYDVHYGMIDAAHQYSTSRSTRVSEIADPGTTNEHALPSGKDHGFMWRLNSYWAFEQAPDGVFVQCEAISLTRDIPSGLGWLIGPFVNSIPQESLQFTLNATRNAMPQRSAVAHKQE
ncbi:MAG TPA: hypothetical protein VGS27_23140 [Candidatus Sulfotelmatobacter sp.]|nr:hypothetical protein [Candidatus Sulfotelmatobacter sp.]